VDIKKIEKQLEKCEWSLKDILTAHIEFSLDGSYDVSEKDKVILNRIYKEMWGV